MEMISVIHLKFIENNMAITLLLLNKKQQLLKRHHHKMVWKFHMWMVRHRMNLRLPLNGKLLPTVHLPWNMYCHCLQPKDLLLQGLPAMDGLVKSPRLRVNQRMEKCFLWIYQILWKRCPLRGSDQVDGMCARTEIRAEIKVARWWPSSIVDREVFMQGAKLCPSTFTCICTYIAYLARSSGERS